MLPHFVILSVPTSSTFSIDFYQAVCLSFMSVCMPLFSTSFCIPLSLSLSLSVSVSVFRVEHLLAEILCLCHLFVCYSLIVTFCILYISVSPIPVFLVLCLMSKVHLFHMHAGVS